MINKPTQSFGCLIDHVYWNYLFDKTPEYNNFCVKGHFFLENGERQHSVSDTENVLEQHQFWSQPQINGYTQLGTWGHRDVIIWLLWY